MERNQTCSNCGAALPPGAAFCESCGKRVPEATVSEPCAPQSVASCPQPCEAEPLAGFDTRPFELFAALPEAMQVERRSLVIVRFRAHADIYESVEFVLRNGSEELVRRPCCHGRPLTVEHQVSLEVRPKACGAARIALDVVCRVGADGETEVHTAILQVAVDGRRTESFSPVFNINQTQTSDRAGDTRGGNINVNLGGLSLHAPEDVSRYETSSNFAPFPVALRKSPPRLTLRGPSGVVQLLSDDVVTFGRNRDNLIPLRVFGADGTIDHDANQNNISRFHFRLAREARDCVVMDGGRSSDQGACGEIVASAYGTRLNGTRLAPAGSARLESGRENLLGVGREDVELRMRLSFSRDSWGRPSGVVVDREDGARLRVCVVWREIRLSESDKILWNGCHWAIASGSSEPRQIAVGTVVSVGGNSFDVLPFHQTHVN